MHMGLLVRMKIIITSLITIPIKWSCFAYFCLVGVCECAEWIDNLSMVIDTQHWKASLYNAYFIVAMEEEILVHRYMSLTYAISCTHCR